MKYFFRIIKRRLLIGFDKVFYHGKWLQLLWIFAIVAAMIGILSWVGQLCNVTNNYRVIELFLDPGSFQGAGEDGNGYVIFQLFVTLAGSVFFTCFLINSVDNILERRVNSYQKGTVYYNFDNHIVILGANDMLINLLRSILADSRNRYRDIAILTLLDAEDVRARINANFTKKEVEHVIVMYGDRSHLPTLQEIETAQAVQIYILGEANESAHDAINIKCFSLLKELCRDNNHIIHCSMVLDRLASINHFYYNTKAESTDNLRLSIINTPEGIAQKVLINRDYCDGIKYPALDRDGIDAGSEIGVHLVLVGMSQMSYALAATAAHTCHFPNFISKGIRTRITFIGNNMREEMDFFRGKYQGLMELSYCRYTNLSDSSQDCEYYPVREFLDADCGEKGFLDVEWEFIDGDISRDGAREYIKECVARDGKSEYLTIAFCSERPEENMAACQYLPFVVYDQNIPLFVYQPEEDELAKSVRSTNMYKNIYPFGMKSDSYDSQYQQRLNAAKRICYLYDVGKGFSSFPSNKELSDMWYKKKYWEQLSNIYSANSIPSKLRSIHHDGISPITDKDIVLLAETEHNRWNMERLLIGFRAYTHAQRIAYGKILANDKAPNYQDTKDLIRDNKVNRLININIAPNSELDDGTKDYDINIVKNILEVWR